MREHPHPINLGIYTLREIQQQHARWSKKNFGKQPSFLMCLGIVEEFSEMTSAITEMHELREALEGKAAFDFATFVDGLGDMLVYMTGYASARGWDMQEAWDSKPNPTRDFARLVMAIGELAHCELKRVQGIRGTEAELEKKAWDAFCRVLGELHGMADVAEYDAVSILNYVWAQVSTRNWKKNPKTGQA